MICPQCGHDQSPEARFCQYCDHSFMEDKASITPVSSDEANAVAEGASIKGTKKKRRLIIALFLGLLLVVAAVICYRYLFSSADKKSVQGIGAERSDIVAAEDKEPSEMEKLQAKEVLEPNNSDPVDYVVGHWMIQEERLRIRKIGDHAYRADDEANDLAYAVNWDGNTYIFEKDDAKITFTIDKLDTLRKRDGTEFGYRLTPSGERKVRFAPTQLHHDINQLTLNQLKTKYAMESPTFDNYNGPFDYIMPTFNMGFGPFDVTRPYRMPANNVTLLFCTQLDTTLDPDASDDLYRNTYDNMPSQLKAYMYWGSCNAFVSGMAEQMSQTKYISALLGISEGEIVLQSDGVYQTKSGLAVSFTFDDNFKKISPSTPVTPNSKVGFWRPAAMGNQ